MNDLAVSDDLNGSEEILLDGLVMRYLIFADMNDDDAKGKLLEVLLEFQTLIDGE